MSQIEPYDTDPDDEQQHDEAPAKLRRRLDILGSEKKALEAELAAVKTKQARDEAFAQAALPDSKMSLFFRQHYDGDPSAEAIRQAALENGIIGETEPGIQAQVDAIGAQSQAFAGADGTINLNTNAAMDAEIDAAAQISSAAVANVLRKYGRPVA